MMTRLSPGMTAREKPRSTCFGAVGLADVAAELDRAAAGGERHHARRRARSRDAEDQEALHRGDQRLEEDVAERVARVVGAGDQGGDPKRGGGRSRSRAVEGAVDAGSRRSRWRSRRRGRGRRAGARRRRRGGGRRVRACPGSPRRLDRALAPPWTAARGRWPVSSASGARPTSAAIRAPVELAELGQLGDAGAVATIGPTPGGSRMRRAGIGQPGVGGMHRGDPARASRSRRRGSAITRPIEARPRASSVCCAPGRLLLAHRRRAAAGGSRAAGGRAAPAAAARRRRSSRAPISAEHARRPPGRSSPATPVARANCRAWRRVDPGCSTPAAASRAAGPAGVAQAEGDILPDGEAVEEGAALEEHAEVAEEGAACRCRRAAGRRSGSRPVVGEDAEDALQRHRLAGARAADDDEALAGHHPEVDAGEHPLGAEGLAHVAELDARRSGSRASEEGLGQEVVGGEDQDGGGDDGVGRGLADALGAAAGVEAVVAAHQRQQEAEDGGLGQARVDVGGGEVVERVLDVGGGVEAEPRGADEVAAEDADDVADRDERRQGEECRRGGGAGPDTSSGRWRAWSARRSAR